MILTVTVLALSLASAGLPLACQMPPCPPKPQEPPRPPDLTELSIEELMKVEITTPARKEQKLMDTPSAVFVILPEDIRRSGARVLPEALRMAPGIEVAQLDANKWAVSCRGFNGRFANKLLVLMDGRSVYTPLFSGVYWDVQETALEDIERIEVIRGPGATLWGANAVNGVINIITKPAWETQGAYGDAGIGTENRDFATARYGGSAGDKFYYRAYGKYLDNAGFDPGNHDDWWMARAGFRTDWKVADKQIVTALGDIYQGREGERVTIPTLTAPFSQTFNQHVPVEGANILARWSLTTSEGSRVTAQSYYETTTRLGGLVDERRDTADVSIDHRIRIASLNDVIYGGEFRFTRDNIHTSPTVTFDPSSRDAVIAAGFVQDDITIIQERLHCVIGSKFEYNTFSRRSDHPIEIQPTVRVAWTPDPVHAVWASASRAVRTPSRGEADTRLNVAAQPGPVEIALFGSHDFKSEELLALELGYRVQPIDALSLDLATFYNMYDDLRTFEPGPPFLETTPAPPHTVLPFTVDNRLAGRSCGVELAVKARPFSFWRIQGAYTFLYLNLIPDDSLDPLAQSPEHESPRNQIYVRSSWDLPSDVSFDLIFRYVSALSAIGIDPVTELDARVAWRPWKNTEISLTGQNLLHRQHFEFAPSLVSTQPTEVERGGYLMVAVRF